jgi:predicted alpha/beta hydrolase family esterase
MKAMEVRQVLFIQGGGDDGYEADKALAASLKKSLGKEYQVDYPEIQTDEALPNFGWTKQIRENIDRFSHGLILVGHSFGASIILKCLSENSVNRITKGIFLLATPFWSGNEEWQKGLKLEDNFADKLPEVPIFLYHCQDDLEVPISHLYHYKQKLTRATFREIKSGGHQFSNDLVLIARDIKSL